VKERFARLVVSELRVEAAYSFTLWIAVGFQRFLKCLSGFSRLQGLSINRHGRHIRLGEQEGSRLSERITVSIELEFFNKYLFNALKRSLYNANPKRKLDIIYYYSRDPRVKFSISMTGYSTTKPNPSPQWSTVFNNIQSMRQYLR
jgi:hypothetical protein